ncbi:ABC transporter permease [Urbifossiella limnaea]|uniref:Macrolide export ATP-binding/permease protein MacB n=1 Tax=Urbifossiella limnaea TaxID=2528023 RepID=A0A517XU67_9BACT|nr:ABC transporter permease [Urbifossiella limnaea]QDU21052.1 Macrolide export ATP-binding/permease protein MacB [Urbifossiella limnaea]
MYFVTFLAKNLLRRRTRTLLTVIGLAVAVAAVVAMMAVGHNIESAVERAFDGRRVDLIVQQAGRSGGLNSDFGETFVHKARELPGVAAVAEGVVNLVDVTRASGTSDQVMIQGWRPDNFGYDDFTLKAGRKLAGGDRRKVMLGATLAGNLGKGVGETVVFGRDDPDDPSNRYEVVGVFDSPVIFEQGSAIVSIEDARALTGMRVTGFSVRVRRSPDVDHDAAVEDARKGIEALRDPADPTARLAAQRPESYINNLSHLKMLRAVSWLVSALGLVVGVIGMLNTMIMSVVERTQEIGILRAVGWPPARVIGMVLGESVLLGVMAAALGTAGAVGATYLLTRFPQVNGFIEPGVSPAVAARGFGLTVLIGLVGGLYPAVRAARLLPTEAIRHD